MRFVPALPRSLATAFLVAAALALAPPAQGQFFAQEASAVQAGVGALPGIGVQAVYVQPRTVFTIEAALYADTQEPFSDGGDRRFQAAGAVGGSLRILRAARIAAGVGLAGNFDVGLRVGPGLRYKAEETRADRNQRFRLLLDPFARYVRSLGGPTGGVRVFVEAGLAQPRLRAGIWLGL